jgi:hypothetical protein
MYAILNVTNNLLEDDGDKVTAFYSDKDRAEAMVAEANELVHRYEAVEVQSLTRYALVDDCILLVPQKTISKCLDLAIFASPEKTQHIESLREKISAMPITDSVSFTAPARNYTYQVRRFDGADLGLSGYQMTGLHTDIFEMMSDVMKQVDDRFHSAVETTGGEVGYAMEQYQVLKYIDKTLVGHQPLCDYERAYKLAELGEGDFISYGDASKNREFTKYSIESIETESGKIESEGSIVVLSGPDQQIVAVHAGELFRSTVEFQDDVEHEFDFSQKPQAKSRMRPR